ncbi:MAG: response regulator [Gammaproteobacteria bacterium]|nr:response regulator [Gammaproteobacteria bacterium]
MSDKKHILIIEDEVKIATLLQDYLHQSGYETSLIHDGAEALATVDKQTPDLILLDIMLPNMNGLDICREVRKTKNTPIIFLTAKVDEIDRIIGLEIGADDYVCKPFSPREVVARVSSVLRRFNIANIPNQSEIKIDEYTYKVTVYGRAIELTAVEFQLFKTMFKQPGRVYSRQQLMDSIYDDHRIVSNRTIDSHIKKLRQNLHGAANNQEFIHSVYGVGYKFEVLS